MRTSSLFVLVVAVASLTACKKSLDGPVACGDGAESATVVQGRDRCQPNSYLLQLANGTAYPADSLGAGFRQAGLKVCVRYTLYADFGMCPCCGGDRLRISHIQKQ